MPNCVKNADECANIEKSVSYKNVVIIGNGPSGLCLSNFLAGNWPYWNKNRVSDEFLQMRLEYCDNGKSLVEQDLEYLSDNLEGRSNNPVSLLFDILKQPDSDLGIDSPTCLNWKYEPSNEIDHIVIGKAAGPGGSWNDLEGSQLTISPCKWMELPNMSFTNWERQNKISVKKSIVNAGLVFSAKNSNFSEDKTLLNANYSPKNSRSDTTYNLKNYLKELKPDDSARASMYDVRSYYRDYVKQKNMDKYLLNNATVTSVRRITCSRLACKSLRSKICDDTNLQDLWEVTGLIDKRDRKKASSLSQGEIYEFRFICRHVVLACGANDLYNNLSVKGDNFRYILRSIRELEDKINADIVRLRKAPLLIVGAGLSAADAILLAKKHQIKIIHVIRRSVNDPELVFGSLPKQSYPEYHEVYEQMRKYRFNSEKNKNNEVDEKDVLKTLLQNDINNNNTHDKDNVNGGFGDNNAKSDDQHDTTPDYILYDEHQVKYFTSKRTCKLVPVTKTSSKAKKSSNFSRHLHLQKQHHDQHKESIEFDEEQELTTNNSTNDQNNSNEIHTDINISFACILIGYAPDLDFLSPDLIGRLATDPKRILNTKDNPILIDSWSHEAVNVKNMYAMGPLIGDNFVRFGTGGALAITNSIVRSIRKEQQIDSHVVKKICCPKIKIEV